jgi:hypothetical protein
MGCVEARVLVSGDVPLAGVLSWCDERRVAVSPPGERRSGSHGEPEGPGIGGTPRSPARTYCLRALPAYRGIRSLPPPGGARLVMMDSLIRSGQSKDRPSPRPYRILSSCV